ncbi:hypothetical protein NXS19_000115 [Fusarium pseudograminearum]|nr:hypothetical protein NXS19_000115 [Fusarium pseudograminearum]
MVEPCWQGPSVGWYLCRNWHVHLHRCAGCCRQGKASSSNHRVLLYTIRCEEDSITHESDTYMDFQGCGYCDKHELPPKEDGEAEAEPPAKASMVITEDDIAEEMRTGVDELLTKFDDELGHCNPDEVVFGELALLDDDKSSGEKAWTVEDPSLKEMKEWIDKHPLKDDKGNPIPIEGPAFKDIGLKWANFKVTAAKESSQAKFVGENNSDKGQRFKAIHISFPVGDAAPTALFTGKNFIQKGNTTGNDVSVEISGVGGVTGLGQDFTPQFKEEDNCIKINILPAAGAECITLPSKASINVLFTGKTGNAGSTACLVREEWFPFGDKSWEDVIVDKA